MDSRIEEYWSETLNLLKDQVNDVVFNICKKELYPLYIEGNTFLFKVDSDLFKVMIKPRHLDIITNILKKVSGENLNTRIVFPEDLQDMPMMSIAEIASQSNLKSKYVFETFVKGKSNELAFAAAAAVAEAPGSTIYNPLFLYGGVGLGKTHLMHSIGNHIIEQNTDKKVLYVSSETFTNELINSIKERKNQEFRNKYREIDVLLIDDIQFLAEKEGTQEEFFHTFNTLYNENKQIVISSDLPPKEIKTLEDRLRSRFGCGLIVDITLPDFETRTAILEKKADFDNIIIPKEVTKFIAKSIVSNIRDLEGALNKVSAFAKFSQNKISLQLAEQALRDVIKESSKKEISVEYIQEIVANYYEITIEEIKSKKRTQNIAYPRQIAMYLSRKLLDLSSTKVGILFGRDHSTITYGCDKITYDMEKDSLLRNVLIDLEDRIKK